MSRKGNPLLPEGLVEEPKQLGPVASGDVLAGGHGHQAGVADLGGHEEQLGRMEVAQEWPQHGHLLAGQRGHVALLQIR